MSDFGQGLETNPSSSQTCRGRPMKIFLAGVGCVGKTTIGASLAKRLGCPFHDLGLEIEKHYGRPIPYLKSQALTPYSFRKRFASPVLKKLVQTNENAGFVIALPPSGLMDALYGVIKSMDCVVIVLKDSAQNILSRITFYDKDSRLIAKTLTEEERVYYLKEIRKDIKYFGRSFRRADIAADIEGLGVEDSAAKIERLLRE